MRFLKIVSAFLSLVLVFMFGVAVSQIATKPVDVQTSEYGVQITYADGTGFWWEFD